jgi:hypothetical protein
MLRVSSEMFYLLLTVEHLPTVETQHLSVRLSFNDFDLMNEFFPLGGLDFYHLVRLIIELERGSQDPY